MDFLILNIVTTWICFWSLPFSNKAVVDTRVTMHGDTIREIKCPCYKCQNISYREKDTVQKPLYKEGFMLRYKTCHEHGENSTHEIGQSSTTMEVDNDDGYRRMVLDNMYSCGYTSDTLEEDVPNPEAKRFYNMLKAVDELLWNGEKATKCSKLQAATSFLTWKSLFNVSVAAYNYNISLVNALLPEENKLPKNFYETKKSLEQLSLPHEIIDVCKDHCMLFYKQDELLMHCKYYKESRYKSDQNKVPNLAMWYMPIGPRLKRLYMSLKTAKDMTWHHDHKTMEEKYEGYLVDKYGPLEDDNEHPEFDKDRWTKASGGKKKEKLYGLSNVNDPLALINRTPTTPPNVHGSQDPKIQRLKGIIEELVKEKEDDKERLNEVI